MKLMSYDSQMKRIKSGAQETRDGRMKVVTGQSPLKNIVCLLSVINCIIRDWLWEESDVGSKPYYVMNLYKIINYYRLLA